MKRAVPIAGIAIAALLGLCCSARPSTATTSSEFTATIARGRYLVAFGACNDCHTPGWRESDGRLPASRWLTGSNIGFRGDWGTSYPANLRLEFQALAEDQWVIAIRTRGGQPPMVWHDLRVLTPQDRHAIYTFVRSLGAAGTQVPAALPPWREPATPYIDTRARKSATGG